MVAHIIRIFMAGTFFCVWLCSAVDRFLRGKLFAVIAMIALFVALFFADLCIIGQVSTRESSNNTPDPVQTGASKRDIGCSIGFLRICDFGLGSERFDASDHNSYFATSTLFRLLLSSGEMCIQY